MRVTHTRASNRARPGREPSSAGPGLSEDVQAPGSSLPLSLNCHCCCRARWRQNPDLAHPRPARPGLLQRLWDGADHTCCFRGLRRGTKEGVGLVRLLVSEVRRDRGAFDVQGPGVRHLTIDLHHHFVILPVDHILCREEEQ